MLHIGTSGWSYKEWKGSFYPEDLPKKQYLTHLSRTFNAVEINSSFYRLPSEKSFQAWRNQTPPGFCFAVKVSRTITHLKRLHDVAGTWHTFLKHASLLGPKLGPLLLQFPANFAATPENLRRLEEFASLAQAPSVRLAFEMRHNTWFASQVLEVFERHKLCLVQAESSRYPHAPANFSPAAFTYYRLHGPRELYASSYTAEELAYWAGLIQKDLALDKDVFIFFDNDVNSYAPANAQHLRALLPQ